jgi:RNA polymerase sigma factor (sigma-70 family)
MSDQHDEGPARDRADRNVTAEMLALLAPHPPDAERLYQKLLAQLTLHASYRGSRDPDDDAAEAIYRGLVNAMAGKVDPRHEGFRKYAFGILRRVILEGVRRARREPPVDPATLPPVPVAAREHERAEVSMTLKQLQHLLPVRDWILLRRYHRESEHTAHCGELGVTANYLRVIVHRLMQKIRENLEK